MKIRIFLTAFITFGLALAGCDFGASPASDEARFVPASPFQTSLETETGGVAAKAPDDAMSIAAIITDCSFTTNGTVYALNGDCTTDGTIGVPDGMTLDGGNHTITAVDPPGGNFVGAVVANEGPTAHVTGLHVTTSALANVCDAGDDRLRGIMFEGASGSITHSTVSNINQGLSGCQEGNAIEVRNEPFDGTHLGTVNVEIAHNVVSAYQKTGIVANGDVNVDTHHNRLTESATQENLAANTIQYGFGATGSISSNDLDGNQWKGLSDFAATAVLIFDADGVTMWSNRIGGNSDIGLYILGDDGTYEKNNVFDEGEDHVNSGYDIGIGDYGAGSMLYKNHVKGFDVPADPASTLEGDKNKVLPNSLEI